MPVVISGACRFTVNCYCRISYRLCTAVTGAAQESQSNRFTGRELHIGPVEIAAPEMGKTGAVGEVVKINHNAVNGESCGIGMPGTGKIGPDAAAICCTAGGLAPQFGEDRTIGAVSIKSPGIPVAVSQFMKCGYGVGYGITFVYRNSIMNNRLAFFVG